MVVVRGWPMPDPLRNTYKEFFSTFNRTIVWNDTISHQAYTRLKKGLGTLKYPCIERAVIQWVEEVTITCTLANKRVFKGISVLAQDANVAKNILHPPRFEMYRTEIEEASRRGAIWMPPSPCSRL
ncbi:hypothetical protein OSTOST_23438 [Ostertagia ostertagi]